MMFRKLLFYVKKEWRFFKYKPLLFLFLWFVRVPLLTSIFLIIKLGEGAECLFDWLSVNLPGISCQDYDNL